jgi:hypothetical protein
MKNIYLFLIVFGMFICTSELRGQLPTTLPSTGTGKLNVGSLLTDFSKAIKPASFIDKWTAGKTGWLASAAKVATAPGVAKSVSQLAGFIKPGMFKKGFNVDNLMSTANTAKTMGDAMGMLKTLEGGLKPEALTSGWADQKTGWLSALSMIK